MLIDGDSITKKTEKLLVDGGNRELLIGKYTVQKDEEDKEMGIIQSDRNVNLPAARTVTDNACLLYTSGLLSVSLLDKQQRQHRRSGIYRLMHTASSFIPTYFAVHH